ncbi:hypothetical protein JCM10207_008001 [Rhodosporidiobolus poonsookiae]
MHHRAPSASHRITLDHPAPSPCPPSTSLPHNDDPRHLDRPRRRTSLPPTDPHSLMRWLVGRLGSRRALALAGLSACALVFLLYSATGSADALAPSPRSSWWRAAAPPVLEDDPDPPVVERTTLEKLRLLEIHFGADEDEPTHDLTGTGYGARPARDPDAPPLVVDIPDVVKPNPALDPAVQGRVPADVLDEQVCGARDGQTCQFLIPAWLGEQETKAQQHLYQLGLLALSLNRTLVLPNVSKSRLGTCYRNPFAFYYSPSSLSSLGIRTLPLDDFIQWTQQRDPPPSAQVVSVVNGRPGVYTAGAVEVDSASDPASVPAKPSRNLCLRAPRTRLDFSAHSPLALFPPEGFHKSENSRLAFGESVVHTLSSGDVAAQSSRRSAAALSSFGAGEDGKAPLPDVLAFNYELRFPILSPARAVLLAPPSPPSSSDDLEAEPEPIPEPLPFAHFPYAAPWVALGDLIAARLSPYIAVHWRTEALTPSNLRPCATSLIEKLLALKQRHPSLQTVYLATDYPVEALDPSLGAGGVEIPHSGTFAKAVTEQHHAAFRRFLREFERRLADPAKLRLTTFSKELAELELPPALAADIAAFTTPPLPPSLDGAPSDPPPPPPTKLDLSTLDTGLFGILDKAVAVHAELFITGMPGVGSSTVGACAKLSSFTNQLVEAREGRMSAQRSQGEGEEEEEREGEEAEKGERETVPGELWNTVAHFSLTGEEVD